MRSWLYSPLLGLSLLCASCVNSSDFDIDSIALDPAVDAPLAFGELKLADLLNNADTSHFKTDDNGLLYIAYDDELLSQDVRNLFHLHDLEVERSFIMAGTVIPPHSEDIRTDSIQASIDFELSPEKLNEIALSGGNIGYSVDLAPQSSNLDYEVFLVLTGFKSRTTSKILNTVIEGEGEIDISDYTISLDENQFALRLVLVFKGTGSSTVIAPATSVNVKLHFGGMDFNYIKGFLGDQTTTMKPRTVAIDIFSRNVFKGADLSLAQPIVNLTVFNENGVPCTIDFTKMEAHTAGADPIAVTLNPPNPMSLEFPTTLGDTRVTHIAVGNVKELMDYAPSEIFYHADVRINPGLTSGNNFMIDSSAMKVRMNIEVPLWGSATGIVLQDTLNVKLDQVKSSEVTGASLKLALVNQFPLGGNVQFILTDENYNPLTTLLLPDQTDVIKASTVDADGELQSEGEYFGLIELDQSKLEDLFEAKYVILVANLQTSRDGSAPAVDVKFKADYGLSINAGIVAQLKLTVE